MPTIADLREELRTVNAEAQRRLDDWHSETDLTLRDSKEEIFERADADAARVAKQLAAAERAAKRETDLETDAELRGHAGRESDEVRRKLLEEVAERGGKGLRKLLKSSEFRDAMEAYANGPKRSGGELSGLSEEIRSTLSVAVDGDGGYAVPETWENIYLGLRDTSPIRDYATLLVTATGGNLHIPRRASGVTGVDIVAESTTGSPVVTPDDAPGIDEVVIPDFEISHMVKASERIVRDALFNVDAFAGDELGYAVGEKASTYYLLGTGSGSAADTQPAGLIPNAAVGVSNVASIGYDQLIDLEHSVKAPYRRNAQWLMNDQTAAILRKLKDSNGRPLWEWGLEKGRPARLLGYEVVIDANVAANGLSAKPIGFGDIRRALVIRDVLGLTIRRLDERFADTGQIAWRARLGTGSANRDANAFKMLQRAAS